MNSSDEFLEKSKDMLVEFYNTLIDADYSLDSENINIIFMSNVGDDYRVLLSTFLDEYLYEISYFGSNGLFCFNVYHLCSHQEYSE